MQAAALKQFSNPPRRVIWSVLCYYAFCTHILCVNKVEQKLFMKFTRIQFVKKLVKMTSCKYVFTGGPCPSVLLEFALDMHVPMFCFLVCINTELS